MVLSLGLDDCPAHRVQVGRNALRPVPAQPEGELGQLRSGHLGRRRHMHLEQRLGRGGLITRCARAITGAKSVVLQHGAIVIVSIVIGRYQSEQSKKVKS